MPRGRTVSPWWASSPWPTWSSWPAPSPSEVDGAAVDRERRLAEDLAQGRMGVRRPADLPWRGVERKGERRLRDEIDRVRPDEVDPQGVVVVLPGDHLREALVLAADEGL